VAPRLNDRITNPMSIAAPDQPPSHRRAAFALLLGTVFWGCGFTWARAGAIAIARRGGLPADASFPPILLLGLRFAGASVIWLACSRSARAGWTPRAVGQSLLVGVPLSLGLILQHVGLDRSSESTSAFLTSLTILFVPIMTTVILRRPPSGVLWIGVAVATAGIWLLTAATQGGFGIGEVLGLGCAMVFSWYILAVNAAKEPASRLVAGQFVIVTLVCFAAAAMLPGRSVLMPGRLAYVLDSPAVWGNLLPLTIFTTVSAFALLTYFQPLLDPTQATLLYLCEPVIATIYAAVAAGHRPTALGIVGAAMILAANVIVELLSGRATRRVEAIVLD
jgi:drug/metabolite transporter (DMT)-like permease